MPSAKSIEAGKAYLRLFVEDNAFKRSLQGTARYLDAWGKSFRSAGLRLAVAGEAILAPFQLATVAFVRAGSELQDMSDRTGVSVEALSELKYALEQTGGNLESAERSLIGFAKFLKQLELGSDNARRVVSSLGISFDELRGKTPDEQLRSVLVALAKIEDPLKRISLVTAVLGKSGTALIPLINQFEVLSKEARELGLLMSSVDAAAADRLGDAFGTLQAAVRSVGNAVAAKLEPHLTSLLRGTVKIVVTLREWARANDGVILGIVALGSALLAAGIALSTIGATFDGIQLLLLGIAAISNPLVIVIAGLGLAAAALNGFGQTAAQVTKFLSDRFSELGPIASQAFKAIANALAGGDIVAATNVLWSALRLAWVTGTEAISDIWRGFAFGLLTTLAEVASGIQVVWASVVASIKSTIADAISEISGVIDFLNTIEGSVGKSPREKLLAFGQLLRRQGDRDRGADDSTEEINRERDARLAIIAAELRARKLAISEGSAANIEAARKELAEAENAFANAKSKAAAANLAGNFEGPALAALNLGSGSGLLAKDTRFRFGGRGAEQVFGGGTSVASLLKQQVDQQRQTNKILQRGRAIVIGNR